MNCQGTLAAAEAAGVLLHLGVKYYSLPLFYKRLDLSNRPTINRLRKIKAYVVTKTTIAATDATNLVKNLRVLLSLKICLILRSNACIVLCPSDKLNDAVQKIFIK